MTSPTQDRRYGVSANLGMKAPCRLATTANITLNALQSIDGVTTAAGDRVLVKDQSTSTQNGIYVADTGTWTRDLDFDGSLDVAEGTVVLIAEGSTNGGKVFRQTTASPIPGSTAITFQEGLFSGITSTYFIQAGTGAVQRVTQDKMRELVSVKDFGATGSGSPTNDAAAINLALAVGGDIYVPAGTYYLGTTALAIPANTRIYCDKNAKFTANTAVPGNLPIAYFVINGDDVEIDGAFLDFVANPFSAYDASHIGAMIRIASGCNRVKIHRCRSNYVMHSVYGGLTDNNLTEIEISHNNFNSIDGDIALLGKSPKDIIVDDNDFPVQQYTPGYVCGGRIQIHTGWSPAAPTSFTQAMYDDDYGERITITNNRMYKSGIRPVRLTNLKEVVIANNSHMSAVGNYTGADNGICDDHYTLNFIRGFSVTGNTVYGGGENFIDVLSCQHGSITGNTCEMIDTTGVMLDFAEQYIADSANNPQLPAITNRLVLINRDITINGNTLQAMFPFEIMNAQGVTFSGNTLSKNPSAVGLVTANWVPISIFDGAAYPGTGYHAYRFFAESRNHWLCNIKMHSNNALIGVPKDCTVDAATDLFTTTTDHEFITGDEIEFTVGGTQTTVTFPTGIFFAWHYFVIKVGAATFRVATSYANAVAGTYEDITAAGLTVAGEKMYAQLAVPNNSISWTNAYIDKNARVEFDENIPSRWQKLASSAVSSGIATGSNNYFTHVAIDVIANPAVDYQGGGPKSDINKYLPIPQSVLMFSTASSAGSTISGTYGMELARQAPNALAFNKGYRLGPWSAMSTDEYVRVRAW